MEALLLVGAAQILYMPDVPDFAAVNETVAAAKCCANKSIAKVVNGVLRNLIRRRAEFEAQLAAAPLAERESYPNHLVKRWIARYGVEGAEALAKWHNQPAETFLAYPPNGLNGLNGFNGIKSPNGLNGPFVRLPRGQRVEDVPGYAEGTFIVQDPATALAVELLDVRPGLSVLDFCAAPGGKTIQIAWRLVPTVSTVPTVPLNCLIAQEVNPARLRRLRANLARLHLDWVKTVGPFEDDQAALGQYDRVLVDAPCSNTGVLRRRPDARWRWTEERLKDLVAQQDAILSAAAAHVAPGGRLVYSTCSNEPEENGDRVAAFLAAHPDFAEESRRESIPHESGHDGAFACALGKCRM
jgi:16S rRNA (cytosine967-C5)-methyltransferase